MKRVLTILGLLCLFVGSLVAKDIKTEYRNALIFAYSPVNSVFEDENIILEIYNEALWAINKTSKTIFIDLSQCFLEHNGSSYPMFSEETDEKKASKKGLSSSIQDVFITIAPNPGRKQNETYICDMSGLYGGTYKTVESATTNFSEYDKRLIAIVDELVTESLSADPKNKNYYGTSSRHLTEDESINNIGASIAYAFNKRAEEWNNVTISTWVSDVIFAPYYVELPEELDNKQKRGFGVKEREPATIHIKADSPFEFEEDKSPIIVGDWEGKFKKGTFTLSHIYLPLYPGKKNKEIEIEPYKKPVPIEKVEHKRILKFEGNTAEWGKLSYSNDVLETKQTK